MKVYLASPLGFAVSTRAYLRELVSALEGHGLTVHDPWGTNRPTPAESAGGPALPIPPALKGFLEARLRPPQPPRPQAGEGERRAERHARNHAIGRRNEDAIRAADGVIAVLDGVDVDSGTAAEIGFAYALGKPVWGLRTDTRQTGDNEGAIVNLQVEYFIEASGGRIARSVDELLAGDDLTPRPPLRRGEGEQQSRLPLSGAERGSGGEVSSSGMGDP